MENYPPDEYQDPGLDPGLDPALPAQYELPEGAEERIEEVRKQGWTERVAIKYDEVAQNDNYQWAAGARRYEWVGEEGDVGPRNEELEDQLFNTNLSSRAGHLLEE